MLQRHHSLSLFTHCSGRWGGHQPHRHRQTGGMVIKGWAAHSGVSVLWGFENTPSVCDDDWTNGLMQSVYLYILNILSLVFFSCSLFNNCLLNGWERRAGGRGGSTYWGLQLLSGLRYPKWYRKLQKPMLLFIPIWSVLFWTEENLLKVNLL